MIARYTRPEIGAVWTDEARFGAMRDVEIAAAEALEDGPTEEELDAIRASTFTVDAINEREKILDHDTAAFVDVLAASAGPAGRWIHYGLTSSDVVDTGLALQLKRAGELLVPAQRTLAHELAEKAREHADTLSVGRTHGVHAEPTSFGLKLAGYAMEAHRNAERLERAFDQITAAISGAVGTFATLGPEYEERVALKLGLKTEPISTQVVPRDRHAELLSAIALAGSGLERFATEIRHLQRTEVREVEEPFGKGQKGSSAMPHKRNPVVSERITGLSRVLRGNAQAALENVALWHERDISHSSPPSGSSCPTRRSCSTRCRRCRCGSCAAWSSTPTGCSRTSRSRPARCSRSACCSRSSSPASSATRPTGSCSASASRPGTRGRRCAR